MLERAVPGLVDHQLSGPGLELVDEAGELQLGDDIVVHGSRAAGTARAASDLDVAIRVDRATFDSLVRERFGTPNPGSAKERTMLHAIDTGKIQSGEAGLRQLRVALEKTVGRDVDVSVVLKGGPFDNGPTLPLLPPGPGR